MLAPPGWRRCRGRFLLAPSPSPPRHCCFHFCSLASAVRIRTGGTQRRGAPTPPRFSEGRVGRVCWRGGADSCLCAPSAATARGFFAGLRFSLLPLFLFFGAAGCLFAGSAPSFVLYCLRFTGLVKAAPRGAVATGMNVSPSGVLLHPPCNPLLPPLMIYHKHPL